MTWFTVAPLGVKDGQALFRVRLKWWAPLGLIRMPMPYLKPLPWYKRPIAAIIVAARAVKMMFRPGGSHAA